MFVLVGVLSVLVVFLAYRVLDAGVTITDYGVTIENQKRDRDLVARLVVFLAEGKTKEDVVDIVEREFPDALVKLEDGIIWAGQIGLKFEGGRLASVLFSDTLIE